MVYQMCLSPAERMIDDDSTSLKKVPMSQEPLIQSRPRMGALWALLLLAIVVGLFGFFCNQSDWISAATTLAIGIAAFGGFRIGALKAFAFLISATATFYLAPHLGMRFENTFSNWIGTTGLANRFYTVLTTGLIVFLLSVIVTLKLGNRILKGRPKATLMNHWLGFLLGGIQGFLFVVILLGALLTMQKVNAERLGEGTPITERAQMFAKIFDKTSEQAKVSRLAPIVAQLNPFEHVPQLKNIGEWQRGMETLIDPTKLNALLDQPAIQELKNRVDVTETIAKLNEDPETRKLLNSNKPVSKELAIKLLYHPAILDLIDQAKFREAAMSAFRDTIKPHTGPGSG